MDDLFEKQVLKLREEHFHILYWAAMAEKKDLLYNITNVFDDLKFIKATRTKQNVVAFIEALDVLCFITISNISNRKNIFITKYGAKALEYLLSKKKYNIKKSLFLEVNR